MLQYRIVGLSLIKMLDSSILKKTVEVKMPFGKYKNTLISDLPMFYLEWFKSKGFPKGNLGMLISTVYEIKLNGLDEILIELKKRKN